MLLRRSTVGSSEHDGHHLTLGLLLGAYRQEPSRQKPCASGGGKPGKHGSLVVSAPVSWEVIAGQPGGNFDLATQTRQHGVTPRNKQCGEDLSVTNNPHFTKRYQHADMHATRVAHANSTRRTAAVVFRGHAFRGLQGLGFLTDDDGLNEAKERFYCTDDAEKIQAALARAHVQRIIEPLEQAGLEVDVLLVTYDCRNVRDASASRALKHSLVSMYSGASRRVSLQTLHRGEGGLCCGGRTRAEWAQLSHSRTAHNQEDVLAHSAELVASAHAQREFVGVLIYRFDLYPRHSMALDWARTRSLVTFDNQALFVPHGRIPEAMRFVANASVRAETRSVEAFSPLRSRSDDAEKWGFFGLPIIYRGPLGQSVRCSTCGRSGDESTVGWCEELRHDFGGPLCSVPYCARAACAAAPLITPPPSDAAAQRRSDVAWMERFWRLLDAGRERPFERDRSRPLEYCQDRSSGRFVHT